MGTTQLEKQSISRRELEVLKLLAQGCTNGEVALALGIGEATVRFHVGRILTKLNVKNRAEAVYFACKNGWFKD